MRILLVNKYFYIKGGTERYVSLLSKALIKAGHQVAVFSMSHPNNIPTKWSKYFVSYVNLKKPSQTGRLKTLRRLFFSLEAQQKIELLIQDFKPDIAHIQNIYGHISPSILFTLKKYQIPIIQTVHDYHLIHPNPNMFHDGKICLISSRSPLLSIFHRCLDKNPFYSFFPSLSFSLHQILKLYPKHVSQFVVPSHFMGQKLIDFGFTPSKITYLPNPIDYKSSKISHYGNYVLYFGQLVEHKGIYQILNVAKKLAHIPFIVAGSGPLENYVKNHAPKNVKVLTHLQGTKLNQIIQNARFVLHPAIWFENQPYSIMESLIANKPVIASNIGGIPEIIKHKSNGLLIQPGNHLELSESIELIWNDQQLYQKLIHGTMKTSKQFLNTQQHVDQLLAIYKKARSLS